MIDDVIVIDDAIPVKQQELLEKIFTDFNLRWGYVNESVDYNHDPVQTDFAINSSQFVHMVYEDAQQVSPTFSYFTSLLTAIPFTFSDIIRLKVNLTVSNNLSTPDTCGAPHTDSIPPPENMLTAIYYINDSDGDTFIFNEKYQDSKTLTVKERIPPKRGRLVIFDGSRYHAGNYPTTNTPRLVANINFFPWIKI